MADGISRLLRLITEKLVNEAASKNESVIATDSWHFKRLKHEIRTNEDIIPKYFVSLMTLLKRFNSKQRQALMSLFDYFFNRSHKFRESTVERLQYVKRILSIIHFLVLLPKLEI